METAQQWRQGILYPRWAEWANWGFGEPRFIFYPPASWILGAALGSVLPWRAAPGAYMWLALIVAGMSMWRLAREWLDTPRARAAAVLYALNPYNLVLGYYRSDFAELLAVALLPLLIWSALHAVRGEWRAVPTLTAIFGGVWLSNAPAAVIVTYSLVVIFAVGCVLRRSAQPMLLGGLAMAGGFGLAAFYILPAAWEQRWVQIEQVISTDLMPAQNFLFSKTNDPEFVLFNWKMSGIAIGMMLISGIAAVFFARRRRELRQLWWTMTALGVVAAVVMLPSSLFVWKLLPELQFIQFPWRWMEVLGVVFAILAAAAFSEKPNLRATWVTVAIAGAGIAISAAFTISDTWWDADGVPTMLDAIQTGQGYEGTDEYAPLGCDRLDLPGNPDDTTRPPGVSPDPAPMIQTFDPDSGEIGAMKGTPLHIDEWSAERKLLSVDGAGPTTLALRLLNFPAWNVRVNGREVRADSTPDTAQMLVAIPAGHQEIDVQFHRTWDRTTGGAISIVSGVALLGFALSLRREPESRGPC
jgi:6-pyruvoyl-tetrahydropterin synthase related domain